MVMVFPGHHRLSFWSSPWHPPSGASPVDFWVNPPSTRGASNLSISSLSLLATKHTLDRLATSGVK